MRAWVVFVMLTSSVGRIAIALALATGIAHADAADPAEFECRQLSEGDACSTGVCTKETCTSGHPGAFTQHDCLVCRPGTPTAQRTTSHAPLLFGLGVGVVALAGGIVFARRRGKRAA